MINIIMWFEGVALTPIIAKILKANTGVIMSVVVVFTVVGSYAINVRTFDIAVMVAFGLLGILLAQDGHSFGSYGIGYHFGFHGRH